MEVKIEELGTITKKLTITLPKNDVLPKLNAAYNKMKTEVRMKGFRRGKVPLSIIKKNYKNQIEGETGEKLVQESYFNAIEQKGLDPIIHPDIKKIHYNDDGTFTYIAEIDVRPEFELAQYKGLQVEKEEIVVNDDEVHDELVKIQKDLAALCPVTDRPIALGDVVIVDFQGYHNGNAMPQVKNENYTADLGSGNLDMGFEEKLIGMRQGEEGSYEVDFPDTFMNPIMRGKKIEFRITVGDIKERILAELNDDFAQNVDEAFATLEDLKISIKDKITAMRERRAEEVITDKIMQELLSKHDFEVPKRLVAFEVEQTIKQAEQQFEKGGMTLEAAGIDKNKLTEENEESCIKRVRGDFILKKIAETEKIKVEDEDLERGLKRIGDQYRMSVAEVKKYFQNRDDLLPLINELLNENILAFLRAEAVVVDIAKTQKKTKKKGV